MSFTEITDEIRLMSYEDKLTLKELLENYLVEERRRVYLEDHKSSISQADKGELEFSENIEDLLHKLS